MSFGVDSGARCLPLPSLPRQYLRHAGILDADGSVLDAPQTKQCHHIHRLLKGMTTGHPVSRLLPAHLCRLTCQALHISQPLPGCLPCQSSVIIAI